MTQKTRNHSAQFKFRVALEAISEMRTSSEIAGEYEVHPSLVRKWKRQLQTDGASIFENPARKKKEEQEQTAKEAELYEQIGRLNMELE